jgi:hypothetical protein
MEAHILTCNVEPGRITWLLKEPVRTGIPTRDLCLTDCLIEIRFIADDKGAYTGALGLLFDATPRLGGPRSKVRKVFVNQIFISTHS